MRINQLIIGSLKSEVAEAELRELEAWRAASPENERYYRDFVALWRLTEHGDDIAVRPPPDVDLIVEGGTPSGPEVVRLAPPSRQVPSRGRAWPWPRGWTAPAAGAAAVMVLGLAVWGLMTSSSRPHGSPLAQGADEFVTGSSETATVGLRDGSVVRLGPGSRLLLSGTIEQREVALRGRAYFAVAPDEARPFRIRAEAGTVTVLGTRFDLQTDGENLGVMVVEGRVALSAGGRHVEVGAGEVGRVLDGTLVPPVRIPDIFSMVDWLGTFLAFQATPLAQVAREVERAYGVRVEITDPALSDQTVTGWFSEKRLDEVLRVVCAVVAAECSIDGVVVRIEPAPEGFVTESPASPRP